MSIRLLYIGACQDCLCLTSFTQSGDRQGRCTLSEAHIAYRNVNVVKELTHVDNLLLKVRIELWIGFQAL